MLQNKYDKAHPLACSLNPSIPLPHSYISECMYFLHIFFAGLDAVAGQNHVKCLFENRSTPLLAQFDECFTQIRFLRRLVSVNVLFLNVIYLLSLQFCCIKGCWIVFEGF